VFRTATFIAVICLCSFSATGAYAQPRVDESEYYKARLVPRNTAKSFIVYHVDTERIVAALNPDYVNSIASLAKMMTCLIADERLKYDIKYTLTQDEAKALKLAQPQAKMSKKDPKESGGLFPDEPPPPPPPVQMTLNQMIDLAMVPSNNTVCKIIARLIDGDESAFANRMTTRAAELGMEESIYCNSTGLPSKFTQHSTARDQLLLALEVLKRPKLIESAAKHSIFHLEQWDSTMLYLKERYAVRGIKTGWTNAAGRCMAILLEHPKHGRFVIVMLKSASIPQGFVDAEIIMSRFGLIQLTPDAGIKPMEGKIPASG